MRERSKPSAQKSDLSPPAVQHGGLPGQSTGRAAAAELPGQRAKCWLLAPEEGQTPSESPGHIWGWAGTGHMVTATWLSAGDRPALPWGSRPPIPQSCLAPVSSAQERSKGPQSLSTAPSASDGGAATQHSTARPARLDRLPVLSERLEKVRPAQLSACGGAGAPPVRLCSVQRKQSGTRLHWLRNSCKHQRIMVFSRQGA